MASTSITTVRNSSNVSQAFPSTFRRHHRALSRLKRHSIRWFCISSLTCGSLKSLRCAFSVPLKVFALSDTINAGIPLLAINRLRHRLKVSTDKSSTNSRWTALVTQHVKRVMYTFLIWPFFALINNGPAKSTPTLENGGAGYTLNSAKLAVGGRANDLLSNLFQTTH